MTGRGNAVAKAARNDLNEAVKSLGGLDTGLYAEKWVPFERELAVMVARSKSGEVVAYPVVETVHEDNICDPDLRRRNDFQQIGPKSARCRKICHCILRRSWNFRSRVVFARRRRDCLVERVRAETAQLWTLYHRSMQLLAIRNALESYLRMALGNPQLKVGGSVMKNILGDGEGEKAMTKCHRMMGKALTIPGASVHWYEKPEVKKARKVGHITTVGASLNEAKERMSEITGDDYSVQPSIGIIMGSDSDLPTMAAAADVLKDFGIECEVTVISAHRTPQEMFEYSKKAHWRH